MKLYSDFAGRRVAQILGDLAAVAVIVVGIVVARTLHDTIASFKAIGANVEKSGSDFSKTMSDIGKQLGGIPFIGGGIKSPFETASDAGGTLRDAGSNWQDGVETLASLVGWTVTVLVVLIVLVGWVRPRIVGAIRRGATARLAERGASLDLLALRALATRPARTIGAIDPDAAGAWRRGDPEAIRRLAQLELRASGIRLD